MVYCPHGFPIEFKNVGHSPTYKSAVEVGLCPTPTYCVFKNLWRTSVHVGGNICLDNYCSNGILPAWLPNAQDCPTIRFAPAGGFLALWRTYDRLRAFEDELFARFELTPQQYNALRLLRAEHPGALPTLAVAERLVSRAPDITRLLDKLDERGLITRVRPPENRRSVLVAIAEPGLTLLDEIAIPLRECHARQLGHLAPADLEKLTELLQAVAHAARTRRQRLEVK